MTGDPAAGVRAALDRLAGDLPALGLAVSGGGDSIALMHIAADWARGRRLAVATVDHGLREGSAAEAQAVAQAAERLSLPHRVLRWQRDGDGGNLMAEAREARLKLLAAWASDSDLPAVALGHTADDVAETLIMRLARGSGIDGLAAMAEWRDAFGMRWLRPMLSAGRADLRDWLGGQRIAWIDDPSNENTDFDRVRVRRAIAALGLDVAGLARSAAHIAEARDAVADFALLASGDVAADRGSLSLPRGPFRDAPAEVRRRLLVAACRWVTGAAYPPRRTALLHAMHGVMAQTRVTVDGAMILTDRDRLRIIREPAAALRAGAATGAVWDRRWRILDLPHGHHVSALGYDALPSTGWRSSGLSRDEAAASPAIWSGTDLVAAPALHNDHAAVIRPLRHVADFRRLVKAH
ncbi:tRNA lysidine(34) synthetase TilS [Paracoccus rhizosphaerae]|uniref:tRNA(Ile)-lysidine synthase n=1 Tax=Paracoccus rhizosphaerae TaxID=1133347 RepID=A0ABV6CFP3_9RHOB|nr:tRNA lysidine(34) synthetase TilS [Paracoccus rhizosphaerae]